MTSWPVLIFWALIVLAGSLVADWVMGTGRWPWQPPARSPYPKDGRCIICDEPLAPRSRRDRITDWLLEPPPFCPDVEVCMRRMHVRHGLER